jgi:signal transduction histidine kinase
MALFINDLLDVSKLETGKLVIHQEPCKVKSILEEVIATIKPLADNKNIRVNYQINTQSNVVLCDEKRIMQVIINLLNNAVKFTESGGHIELTAEDQNEDTLKISVRDTGCGIPSNELNHIFERLYQVVNDNINYNSGLGLGLSICKQIVELHGGEISVNSKINVGSTFSFTLKKAFEKETTQV